MVNCLKKSHLTLFFALILVLSLIQGARAQSDTPPWLQPLTDQQKADEAKAVAFLTNVTGLDMKKYDVKLGVDRHEPYDPNLPPPRSEETVHCNLTTTDGRILNVICMFRGDSVIWCKLYPIKGSPLFAQSKPSNDIIATKNLLDRLQNFSATTYLPTMRSMLDSVSKIEYSNITIGDTKLEILVEGASTTFMEGTSTTFIWSSAIKDAENNQKVVAITLHDGQFEFFADNWNLYKIGNADVKISREEAIEIAKEHARAYVWTAGNVTVSNVGFADIPVDAELSMQDRGNYTLYPIWFILLPLDKVYPGLVTGIQIEVWADSGEVSSINPSGAGGAPPTPQPSSSLTASSAVDSTGYTIVAVVITLIATAALSGYLFYKRKR